MKKIETPSDEFTTEMHSDFKVSQDTDRQHVIWTAIDVIQNGLMSKREAAQAYGISEDDLINKY